MSSSLTNKICPYIHDKDCGRPNKLTYYECCGNYKSCWSYICLKKAESLMEDWKNGKNNSDETRGAVD